MRKDGKGTHIGVNGVKYEGDWKNGEIDGKDIMVSATGERYEG